ncbi:MAG: type I-E CRISPR-associated protein Cse1/CasA [Enterovibrio sp.]
MDNQFNLIDEPWIPVAGHGRVSLKSIFSDQELIKKSRLGGNAVQQIALLKMLQAIAQAAYTPQNQAQWQSLGRDGLVNNVLSYLEKWHAAFYLYGEHPFLQMPAIKVAKIQPLGALLPDVATGNTTVLTQTHIEPEFDDGDKALLLLTLMALAMGGKKADNSVVLTPGYQGKFNDKGKASTPKPAAAVAHMGLLHTYCVGASIIDTLWLNLFTQEEIESLTIYPNGLGTPPWEQMPEGEDCAIAKKLKGSLMGRLLPLSRFCLLAKDGVHCSEGVYHSGHNEGIFDPSISIDLGGKKPKVRWADPSRRPWRDLTSMLAFIANQKSQFECISLRLAIEKGRKITSTLTQLGIWSGGLQVSSNAGEQYVSGSNDIVESLYWLPIEDVGESWFMQLNSELNALDTVSRTLYGCVMAYYKDLKVDGKNYAAQASNRFWQLCEHDSQMLINECDEPASRKLLRQQFSRYAQQIFHTSCPAVTARQLEAWAKTRPNFYKYEQEA